MTSLGVALRTPIVAAANARWGSANLRRLFRQSSASMLARLVHFAVAVAHEIGILMLVGGLFFALFTQMPAIARIRSSRQRALLRQEAFQQVFLWGWLGLLLLWTTAAYRLFAAVEPLPAYVTAMGLLSAAFTLLFLIAQFGLYMQVVYALEEGGSGRASWLGRRLRAVLSVAFVLALTITLLDVTGPALTVPAVTGR